LIDEETQAIHGHMGLVPLPLTLNSKQFLAGSISNGVVDHSVRNRLLPHNNAKSFPIVPLINECCNMSFADDAEIVFAFSSIHPLIWKAIAFEKLKVEFEETWHLDFGKTYLIVGSKLQMAIKNTLLRYPTPMFTFLFSFGVMIRKFIQKIVVTGAFKKDKVEIEKFQYFDNSLDVLFEQFTREYPTVTMYQRRSSSLNWRYSKAEHIKYKFTQNGKLVGYCVLCRDRSNNSLIYNVEDFLILKSFFGSVSGILIYLHCNEKLLFRMQHFLTCDYSYQLYGEFRKFGHSLELMRSSHFWRTPNPS
jgi:hypothetical protein